MKTDLLLSYGAQLCRHLAKIIPSPMTFIVIFRRLIIIGIFSYLCSMYKRKENPIRTKEKNLFDGYNVVMYEYYVLTATL